MAAKCEFTCIEFSSICSNKDEDRINTHLNLHSIFSVYIGLQGKAQITRGPVVFLVLHTVLVSCTFDTGVKTLNENLKCNEYD